MTERMAPDRSQARPGHGSSGPPPEAESPTLDAYILIYLTSDPAPFGRWKGLLRLFRSLLGVPAARQKKVTR